jgi:hypothetical protein
MPLNFLGRGPCFILCSRLANLKQPFEMIGEGSKPFRVGERD